MSAFLPWVLLALGAVAAFLDRSEPERRANWSLSAVTAWVLAAVFGVGAWQGVVSFEFSPAWVGALGLVVLAGWRPWATTGALGFVGTIVASSLGAVGRQGETAYLLVALIGVASLGLLFGCARTAGVAGLVGIAGVAGRYLLVANPSENVQALPGALILALVIVGVIATVVPLKEKASWTGYLWGALAVGGMAAVVQALYPGGDRALIVAVSGAAALVTAWAMPGEDRPDAVKVGFAGLVWLGIATFAFSRGLTPGMVWALLAGAGVIGLTRSLAGVAMLAPLLGLIGHRMARNIYPDSVRAFDLGQHYAIVGVVLAACVGILLAQAFERARLSGENRMVASAAVGWVLVAMAVLFSVVFLGAKGSTGLIVGLGLAPLLVQLSKADGAGAAAVGAGLIGTLGMAFPRLSELFETSRRDKQTMFLVAVAVGLVLAGFLMWLGREKKEANDVA